ncbi:SprT-like domain-containing protein [Leucobacter japonicus]|uniref:SprT-like domain-containing protein n=1 Tax=Leucobacter japonicus TaxID=1461259 RepID=UPI0006A7A6B0|nr:SprT-like domain-containing protein [Leucobacter japonicus]
MSDLARVRVWAEALITAHLQPQLAPGDRPWSFAFDHAKRRAGLCNYTDRRITVSRYLAEKFDDDEIHQVLLHEVAHALAGPEAGHGATWKTIARDLGYVGGVTHHGEIAHERAPWVGRCSAGHEHYRFRKPTRLHSCGQCAKRFAPEHVISWRSRD